MVRTKQYQQKKKKRMQNDDQSSNADNDDDGGHSLKHTETTHQKVITSMILS